MKSRVVQPEILDQLPHDDPAARRSRADLRLINFLMGNERWVLRTLRRIPDAATSIIREWGAGDGELAAKIRRRFPASRVCACDLAPRPAGLDARIEWHAGDVMEDEPEPGGVLVANLFLHHFESDGLSLLGKLCHGSEVLVFCEPDRIRIASLLGAVLHPFVNHVTRHDMQVSIRAGFRHGEMTALLGLDPAVWRIEETSTWRGARRVVARRIQGCSV